MQRLYKKLTDYAASDYYPFHMPGHKRNPGITGADLPYEIDITEIEGFDDLHHASSVLKEAEERAAEAYDVLRNPERRANYDRFGTAEPGPHYSCPTCRSVTIEIVIKTAFRCFLRQRARDRSDAVSPHSRDNVG